MFEINVKEDNDEFFKQWTQELQKELPVFWNEFQENDFE